MGNQCDFVFFLFFLSPSKLLKGVSFHFVAISLPKKKKRNAHSYAVLNSSLTKCSSRHFSAPTNKTRCSRKATRRCSGLSNPPIVRLTLIGEARSLRFRRCRETARGARLTLAELEGQRDTTRRSFCVCARNDEKKNRTRLFDSTDRTSNATSLNCDAIDDAWRRFAGIETLFR